MGASTDLSFCISLRVLLGCGWPRIVCFLFLYDRIEYWLLHSYWLHRVHSMSRLILRAAESLVYDMLVKYLEYDNIDNPQAHMPGIALLVSRSETRCI